MAEPALPRPTWASSADGLLAHRLQLLGLAPVASVRTHTNSCVLLSLSPTRRLRLHRGYADAPDRILSSIVRLLSPRLSGAVRAVARRIFLSYPVESRAPAPARRPPRAERPRPGDDLLLARLLALHAELNRQHFGGVLSSIPIQLSGRMRTRLGELAADRRSGRALAITIGRRHLAREPWADVAHTLLHEMVHQWQAESGLPLDHGAGFRTKAREVGIDPRARRDLRRRLRPAPCGSAAASRSCYD